jgi:4-oxalocrotonate tautomerase
MPHIVVNGPPLKDLDKRRVLVKDIADSVQKVYGVPREAIIVVIREDDASNVAQGGKLLSDR